MDLKQKKPRKPKLDQSEGLKYVDDVVVVSTSNDSADSPVSNRSLDVEPSIDRTSFRIEGIEGEFEVICRSLGLSGPDDFAIPAAARESRILRSSSDILPRSNLNKLDKSFGISEIDDKFSGNVRVSDVVSDVGEANNDSVVFNELDHNELDDKFRENVRISDVKEFVEGSDRLINNSGGGGGRGINVVRPPVLTPPPMISLPVIDDNSSTWDILRSFAPEGDKSSDFVYGRGFSSDDDDDNGESGEGQRNDNDNLFTTSNDDDSSSSTTEPPSNNSLQGKSRRIIGSWEKGRLLGRGSFGSVYEGIAEMEVQVDFSRSDSRLFDISVLLGQMEKMFELNSKFISVRNLKVLNIVSYKLTDIPDNINFPDLEELVFHPNLNITYIPPSLFKQMPALKVLDMSNTSIKTLPPISKWMEKISFRGCELLMELPQEICTLVNLKELDFEGIDLVCLPKEIGKLIQLKCLKLSLYNDESYRRSKDIVAIIPDEALSSLAQLEELSIKIVPHDIWCAVAVKTIIKDLPSLRMLKTLELYLPTFELFEDLMELKRSDNGLPIHQTLSNFSFIIGPDGQRFISRLPCDLDAEFIKLKKCVKYVNGEGNNNTLARALEHANALYIDRHWTIQKLSVFKLEELKKLKFCLLVDCNEMHTVFDGSDLNLGVANNEDSDNLSLQYLAIHYLKNLQVIWKGPGVGCCLHSLKVLTLHMCPNLNTMFTKVLLGDLVNLKEIIVEDCPKIKTLIADDGSQFTSEQTLPELKKLSLFYLPELVSISSGISIGLKLENIIIYDCPKLKRFPSLCNEKVVTTIKGEREWWDALEWNEPEWSDGRPNYLGDAFSELDPDGDEVAAPGYENSLRLLLVEECNDNLKSEDPSMKLLNVHQPELNQKLLDTDTSGSGRHGYYGNPAYGLGLSYPGSPLASPVLPHSPVGPGSPIRHGDVNKRFSSGMRNLVGGGVMGPWHLDASNMEHSFASSLLEEFKSNKTRCFELLEITGHVVEFSADQYGSRFIQQKLETATTEEKNMVYLEIIPQALTLMTDVFGNYVIQKFFEHGMASQRRELANKLIGNVLSLSLQMYGCRVIQKAIEVVDLDQKIEMVGELDGHVLRCVRDQNGNHVIQKCIECVPEDHIQFIITTFFDQVVTLSTHPYGCRVIQRVLEHCEDQQTQNKVMDEILANVSMLAQNQYGNYVVQHVLEHGKPNERSTIIQELAGKIVQMSQQKFASNVVEKCLTFGDPSERQLLVTEMLGTTDENEPLQAMMKDQFANYVVQKVLETCSDQERELIMTRIKVHLNALKKYTYGKHIVARVEKLVAAGERRAAQSQQVV